MCWSQVVCFEKLAAFKYFHIQRFLRLHVITDVTLFGVPDKNASYTENCNEQEKHIRQPVDMD